MSQTTTVRAVPLDNICFCFLRRSFSHRDTQSGGDLLTEPALYLTFTQLGRTPAGSSPAVLWGEVLPGSSAAPASKPPRRQVQSCGRVAGDARRGGSVLPRPAQEDAQHPAAPPASRARNSLGSATVGTRGANTQGPGPGSLLSLLHLRLHEEKGRPSAPPRGRVAQRRGAPGRFPVLPPLLAPPPPSPRPAQ